MADVAKYNGIAITDIAKINGIAIGDIAKINGCTVVTGLGTSWQPIDPTTLTGATASGADPIVTDFADDGTDYTITVDATATGVQIYPLGALTTADGQPLDMTDPTVIRMVMRCAAISAAEGGVALVMGIKGDDSDTDTIGSGFSPVTFGTTYYLAGTETGGVYVVTTGNRLISTYRSIELVFSPIDGKGAAATYDHTQFSLIDATELPSSDVVREAALVGSFEGAYIAVISDGGGAGNVQLKIPNDLIGYYCYSLESMSL